MAQRFTRKEIEARNHKEDAVIIIDNVVYDITSFLDDHPGGIEVLLNNAGRDASRCFHEVGHTEDAKLWRQRFKIGEVVDEDQWEVIRPQSTKARSEDQLTLRGLIDIFVPPLLIGVIAVVLYLYLFS